MTMPHGEEAEGFPEGTATDPVAPAVAFSCVPTHSTGAS